MSDWRDDLDQGKRPMPTSMRPSTGATPFVAMVRREIMAPNGDVFRVVWECGHCALELSSSARFCPWCGFAIDPSTRP